MLHIDNVYAKQEADQVRLCADLSLNGKGTTLWFGVDKHQQDYLCTNRSDAFVMSLLPTAMREGQDLVSETPMSERLHYQLENYLIPSLCSAGDLYHPISIKAPLTSERLKSKGGIGTGFSGGVDCLYTIMTHNQTSIYPVSHIAVFNLLVFQGPNSQQAFRGACQDAKRFAEEMGLELITLDSNITKVLPERPLDIYSFRNLAGAMVLQGGLSHYLLSSGHDVANFSFDLHNSATYDLLTVHCAQTESQSFYLSGAQTNRSQKLAALSAWEPSYRWLHPCFHQVVGNHNCGHCKKCARDMTTLYALGTLDRYAAVFDIPAYKRALPQRIGFVLANRGNHLFDETIDLLEKNQIKIPPAAYVCEQQFRKAMQHLQGDQS